jgi:rhamnogalacturonyl hydrolase YesR
VNKQNRRGVSWLVAMLLSCVALCAQAQAADYFDNWPDGSSPQVIGKRVSERFVATPHFIRKDNGSIHYAEAATWYGALNFASLSADKDLSARLIQRLDASFALDDRTVPPANHVDFVVFGIVPLEIYIQTAGIKYRSMGLSLADAQWDQPLPDGLTRQTRFWIDDTYMITMAQLQAYRATGNALYVNRAATEMVVYLKRLQQPNGLFFHTPEAPFFWGRGNGWVAAGMTEMLRSLPDRHPQRARILASYRKMMAALLKYQSPDGSWRQLIDHPESWPETSSTGMFTFAFVSGVKNGWLKADQYGPAARKGWLALVSYLNENADLKEVCVGTNAKNDLQHYLDRPRAVGDMHGQAPVLWTASALLRPSVNSVSAH